MRRLLASIILLSLAVQVVQVVVEVVEQVVYAQQ